MTAFLILERQNRQCITLHIVYGGLRHENEHFSCKYKSV
jgi:hypothetical protein